MHIQEATIEDIPVLCELLQILFSKEVEFIPNITVQKNALEMIVRNEEIGKIFVLKKEDKTIGMVSLLFSISTALGGKVAWLEDMIVNPMYHNQGGGTQLLRHAIAYAKKLTCKRITLLTDESNSEAKRFYKRFGFEESVMKPMRIIFQ